MITQRHPIGDMDAESILREFTQDAIRFEATPLPRFVEGMVRVARVRGLGDTEDAYQLLLDRVEQLTGRRALPMTNLSFR